MMKKHTILFVLIFISLMALCGTVSAADNVTDEVNAQELQTENPDPPLTIVKGSNDSAGGLDSNNVGVGPNQTMIQFHVTNPDLVNTAHNVVATFSWTSSNIYVNLAPNQPSSINLGDIAPGATKDVFYLVEFTRNANARGTTRNYQVDIAGTDTPPYAPTGQILVSSLTSQQSNSITGITVSNTHPQLGDIITVTVTSATSSTSINSIVNYLVGYNPGMLQVLSLVTNYTSGGVPRTSNNVYIPNPNANAFTNTWTLLVTSNNISNIYGAVMDQRSNNFRYNGDYGTDIVSTYVPASVGNLVWDDLNANGRYDTGEPGLPNVLVTLYDSVGTPLETRVTDASGYFYFTTLYPQSYYLYSPHPPDTTSAP